MSNYDVQELVAIAIVIGVAAWVLWRWWQRRSATTGSSCDSCGNADGGAENGVVKETTLRFQRRKR